MDIQTKIICDDINCEACKYETGNNHTGNVTKLISCDYISFGDYDNSCAVERANVRYLEQNNLIAYKETGSYYWEKAWLLDNEENREILNALENYPCFDDELVSEIEMEIEEEYIKDNDDIFRATKEPLKSVLDDLDFRTIDTEIYYKVKEELNMEFIVESGGNGYIDLDKMVDCYNKLLIEKYPFIEKLVAVQNALDKPEFPISFYFDANEMLNNVKCLNREITQDEIKEILAYTVELENLIDNLKN